MNHLPAALSKRTAMERGVDLWTAFLDGDRTNAEEWTTAIRSEAMRTICLFILFVELDFSFRRGEDRR